MKKLFLALILCLTCAVVSAQPPKGGFTISGDYQFEYAKGQENPYHTGFIGLEYFIKDGLSLGVGVSYNDDTRFRYGIQVNYFIPIRESSFYFSILNFASIGKENDKWRPSITVTPAFNYDISNHWTVYAALANLEVGFNDIYCRFNLNSPRLGFLFSF